MLSKCVNRLYGWTDSCHSARNSETSVGGSAPIAARIRINWSNRATVSPSRTTIAAISQFSEEFKAASAVGSKALAGTASNSDKRRISTDILLLLDRPPDRRPGNRKLGRCSGTHRHKGNLVLLFSQRYFSAIEERRLVIDLPVLVRKKLWAWLEQSDEEIGAPESSHGRGATTILLAVAAELKIEHGWDEISGLPLDEPGIVRSPLHHLMLAGHEHLVFDIVELAHGYMGHREKDE